MTLNQLRYFRVLAKTEHYTKAADALDISQPSLSRAIALLEEELGVLLSMVQAGLGLFISTDHPQMYSPDTVLVPLKQERYRRYVYMVTRPGLAASTAAASSSGTTSAAPSRSGAASPVPTAEATSDGGKGNILALSGRFASSSPKGRASGEIGNFAWTAKGSHFGGAGKACKALTERARMLKENVCSDSLIFSKSEMKDCRHFNLYKKLTASLLPAASAPRADLCIRRCTGCASRRRRGQGPAPSQ